MVGRVPWEELVMKSTALALEYQSEYGSACGNVDVANFVNNPNGSGVVRVFGPGFFEKTSDLPLVERGVLVENIANTLLVRQE